MAQMDYYGPAAQTRPINDSIDGYSLTDTGLRLGSRDERPDLGG